MPRAKRICPRPGCPNAADGRYCPTHNAEYEAKRGSANSRGYNADHRQLRNQWAPKVDAGQVNCARCGTLIKPGRPWALDHSDDRASYLGPSHKHCNDAAGGKAAHR